jgi:TolB-like protein
MRRAVTRIWDATRDRLARWFGAGSPPHADAMAEHAPTPPAVLAAEPVPVAKAVAPPGVPSIAVLPFNNISGEVDQEYFADGITGDITNQLSRSRALFVMPRKSSFAYKGRSMKLNQLGRELGADYILGGNVKLDGTQVQIVARLVEAETGKQMWAKQFARAVVDLSEVQDAIADAVALAIEPGISPTERQRIAAAPIVSMRAVIGATASGRTIVCADRA